MKKSMFYTCDLFNSYSICLYDIFLSNWSRGKQTLLVWVRNDRVGDETTGYETTGNPSSKLKTTYVFFLGWIVKGCLSTCKAHIRHYVQVPSYLEKSQSKTFMRENIVECSAWKSSELHTPKSRKLTSGRPKALGCFHLWKSGTPPEEEK